MAANRAKRRSGDQDVELQLTPMIDVVFQLLIFFLCATKFPDPEGVLKSWLPKDKGQDVTSVPSVDLNDERIILRKEGGRVVCMHQDDASPTGFARFEQVSVAGESTERPNWQQVESYLYSKKQEFDQSQMGKKGLPVILDFSGAVEWKYVVRVVNICTKLDITNIQIAAPELPW